MNSCYMILHYVWSRLKLLRLIHERSSTVRAPVFDRLHQFFGTSEHYGKAHGSLLSGWLNYNYTACCWFPTPSNILMLPSQFFLTNQVWKLLIALFKVPNTGAFTVLGYADMKYAYKHFLSVECTGMETSSCKQYITLYGIESMIFSFWYRYLNCISA